MGDATTPVTDAAWGAHAYAVCVNPLPGQRLVAANTASSTADKTVSVACPSGTQVHGTGAGLAGALGEAHLDRVGVFGAANLGGADVDARQDVDGAAAPWSAYAFAICAG
jgi:hypothetical protein